MNITNHLFKAGRGNGVLYAALLLTLTGCVARIEGPPRGEVYVAPPVVVVQDDYVYYPSYGVYYSSSRHQYAYLDRGAWVSRPSPRGVSVNVLLASPSVRMNFHDSPANHHAEIARQYPKNWAPARGNENRKENKFDERGDNNRR